MINYYKILGVTEIASFSDIKKAYRREALKWHPDKNHSPEAEDRMKLINEARFILSDTDARSRYDQELNSYRSFQKHKKDDREVETDDYIFNDEVLFNWINNAKKQSADLAKASIDDLIGMSAAGASAFYHKTKYLILLYVVLLLLLMFSK